MKIYVTYDLEQTGNTRKPITYRGAKTVEVDGQLVTWSVGEYKIRGVEDVFGVTIVYQTPERRLRQEIVSVSGYARNVEVHTTLPAQYREGLKNAA